MNEDIPETQPPEPISTGDKPNEARYFSEETHASEANAPEKGSSSMQLSPTRIGRFRIERILGEGGFGVVYLGHDDQLHRKVAIKVPKPQFVELSEDRELYLKEARTVAGLEHPNIVPVLEVGSSPEFPIYVVSKYIPGQDLATLAKSSRPSSLQAARWMIDIADALREAHRNGFVHRDVKPQNILVDENERVYLVDFGLALADQDVGKRLPAGGTPAYMSPEQARGEGHRVDGRSDLFSLGILFYELLCGRRPFSGSTHLELSEQIAEFDPKPLRQWDDSIPLELERICFKLLAKRKSDRYSNANDLAEDLRVFLSKTEVLEPVESRDNTFALQDSTNDTKRPTDEATPLAVTPTSDSPSAKIIPRGLRSFDHRDASFFLPLLPGPVDRHGLPESVVFWKSRIEERNVDLTFAVGLVYGPSGCGKSSLMKAGILPRISSDVVSVYLEATQDDTEQRLLTLLHKKLEVKDAESSKGLCTIIKEIRLGRILPRSKKLVIIIDQFEQWLSSHPKHTGEPLLESLLQCDGARVQAIVMVRDDFWMATTRFFRDLEIRLLDGSNSSAVELFDLDHAERVLKAFGRAFGKIEPNGEEDRKDRKQFIREAVKGLAENGKVSSVRLSLFAEMMKSRLWTLVALRELGGTAGVGITFLEETFSASGAPPQHRFHQDAARYVLRALLPVAGSELKGHSRSTDELRSACRYDNRPKDFDDLVRILDIELRLITPVDNSAILVLESTYDATHYQLTHDYLVPSLRDWLTQKQRETKKGRAELKLAERSAAWSGKCENKQLPTLSEWLSIYALTDSRKWTHPERAVMVRAAKVHRNWWGGLLLVTLLISAGVGRWISNERAISARRQMLTIVESLQNAIGESVPNNLSALAKLPNELVLPELQTRFASAKNERQKLSLAIALARYEELNAEYLVSQIDQIAKQDSQSYIEALRVDMPVALSFILKESAKCVDRAFWSRKAKLAIVALNLGDTSIASQMCAFDDTPLPEQRSLFLDEFPRWENHLKRLHDYLRPCDDPALTSGICLGVGQIEVEKIKSGDRELWQNLASVWFEEKNDTSTHSASGWLLRKWGIAEPKVSNRFKADSKRNWFVNSVGSTMLKIPSLLPNSSELEEAKILPQDSAKWFELLTDSALENPETRLGRARELSKLGEFELAFHDIDWLIKNGTDKTLLETLQLRAILLARLGKRQQAMEALESYLQIEHPDSYTYHVQIEVLTRIGDIEDALKLLEVVPCNSARQILDKARILSLCVKATSEASPSNAKQFGVQALSILSSLMSKRLIDKTVLMEPVFECLRPEKAFASLLDEANTIQEFWVADREISRYQYELFVNDESYPADEKPLLWEGIDTQSSPTADHPAVGISWCDSVLFCNWLSRKEGLNPHYKRTGVKQVDWSSNEVEGWEFVSSTNANGYFLLSGQEWEYACGSRIDFFFDSDKSLQSKYSVFGFKKESLRCGDKIPNAWGIFDAYGNAAEWCDKISQIQDGVARELYGGSFGDLEPRLGYLNSSSPIHRGKTFGARIAIRRPKDGVDKH